MRDTAQRCSRWRRVRKSSSPRLGRTIDVKRITSLPSSAFMTSIDNSRNAGTVEVACTWNVLVLVCSLVSSEAGRAGTGSYRCGLGPVAFVMAAMVGGGAHFLNVQRTETRT